MRVGLTECGGEPVTCMVIVLKDVHVLTKIMGKNTSFPSMLTHIIKFKIIYSRKTLVVKGEIQEASIIEPNSHLSTRKSIH